MEVDGYEDPAIEQKLGYWELSSYAEGGVYFSAFKNEGGLFTGRITYNNVLLNKGNGLSGSTGVFTAPTQGYYSFSFSGQQGEFDNEGVAGVIVRLNGNNVFTIVDAASKSDRKYDIMSYVFQLYLSKNDKVDLEVPSADKLYADSDFHITFSGHLIYAE